MKKRQTVFLIIVIVVLAAVGYFYYSLDDIQASPGGESFRSWLPRELTRAFTTTELSWIQEQKLVASDAYGGQMLGSSAAIDGDVAILGAPYDPTFSGSDPGSAYIYRFDGYEWIEEQKLLASDGVDDDQFGYSVSVSGDVAVVASPYDDDLGSDSGSVYVYRFNGVNWVEEQKLLASDGAASDKFGRSISVSDDVIVIGASSDDWAPCGNNCGAAYVFRFDGLSWVEEQKLLASDGASADSFGYSVSVSGNVAFVGALGVDDFGSMSGATYVFRYDGNQWIEKQKLTPIDAEQWIQFGYFVDVSGDVAVIGANRDNDHGSDSGSAYVFRFNGVDWVEESKLLASDGAVGDDFGSAVSVSGNTAVIGAHLNGELGWKAGATYVYRFDGLTWVEEVKLLASDGYSLDEFGSAVAVCDDVIVVGAKGEDSLYMSTGAAYIFRSTENEIRNI
ncbi:MAG: FG-GAP repeat protein [Nanoarchaeota archaeon]|nr:FG-GAP repeat protein [Nanoarchaeota archaeon]MBU1103038.1 FG-GAP repeat protein [Nanoarchaeota archaeon]